MKIGTEIAFIIALIIINGLFSFSELAIVSSRKSKLQKMADSGDKRALHALELSNAPGPFLSTVQIGITLTGILSGAFGGATLSESIEKYIVENSPALGNYAEPISVIIVVAVVTYLSVVVGELIPKHIALSNPEKLALKVAGPMRALSKISSPIVRLFSSSTNLALSLLGIEPAKHETVTQEEIRTLVEQGAQAGILEIQEKAMMDRVMAFGDRKVHTIMTPRPDVVWLDINESDEKKFEKIKASPHSSFPVVNDNFDNILGTVRLKDLYVKKCVTDFKSLSEVLQPPVFMPESVSALSVLEHFKRTGAYVAYIIDEYGSMLGIVTSDDILQAIVGELNPKSHPTESYIIERGDGSWLVDGTIPIEDFKEALSIPKLPDERRGTYTTLAGFLMHISGRVPREAEIFHWENYQFEIMDMDKNRIDKVLVTKLAKKSKKPDVTARVSEQLT